MIIKSTVHLPPFLSPLSPLSLPSSLSPSPLPYRSTCDQLSKVIEQLEQDRGVASKRARRLQDELQRVQQVKIIHSSPSTRRSSV